MIALEKSELSRIQDALTQEVKMSRSETGLSCSFYYGLVLLLKTNEPDRDVEPILNTLRVKNYSLILSYVMAQCFEIWKEKNKCGKYLTEAVFRLIAGHFYNEEATTLREKLESDCAILAQHFKSELSLPISQE